MKNSKNPILLALIAVPVIVPAIWFILMWLFDGKIEYVPQVAFQTIFYSNSLGGMCLLMVGTEFVVGSIILLLIPYEDINAGRYFKHALFTLLICFISFIALFFGDKLFNNDNSNDYKSYEPVASILWNSDEIYSYEDKCVTIEGPIVSGTYSPNSKSMPTFLDMGEEYPSESRVSIVIWGEYRNKFKQNKITPETYYKHKTIRVTGIVTYYNGIFQIEVTDPAQIQIL